MGRESLSTQGELDLVGAKGGCDDYPDALAIDGADSTTDAADESNQGDRDPLASWRELTGYHEGIDISNPDAMRRLTYAIIEKANSFDRTTKRIQFLFDAAGPVIGSLFEAHYNEYAREDGSLDPHTIRADVMGRLSGIFGVDATAVALVKWFEEHSEYFERSSANKASREISQTAVRAVVSS